MAYLGKYIRQILSRKEAVIFPGFGSLVISESKGVAGEGGAIDPPGMMVKFDATHPKDDGILANEYSEGEGLSSDEAAQQVLELVDAIKFKLDKGEKYKLELVGEFSRDDDNKVHFVKDVNWVMDPELFGLSSLDLLELDADEAGEQGSEGEAEQGSRGAGEQGSRGEAEQGSRGEVEKGSEGAGEKVRLAKAAGTKTTGTKASGMKTEKKKPVKRAPVNKWKIIWIVVGALIVVLVAILLIPSGNDGVDFGKDGIVFKDSVSDDAAISDPSEIDGIDPNEGEDIDGARDDGTGGINDDGNDDGQADSGNEPEDNIPEAVNHYYVIAGSFQSLQNATELQNTLISKGYKSELIHTENRMYRVAVQGYPTKQEANAELSEIKRVTGLAGVWVLYR